MKFDGYRILASVDHGKVRLLTRNGLDWAARLPALARAVAALNVRAALLDGELVALDDNGISSFPALQAALKSGQDDRLFYYVFDLLHFDGWDIRRCTLRDRKNLLAPLLEGSDMLRYSDHQDGEPERMWRAACRRHLEGIICKQGGSLYHSGRGGSWLKVKCGGREEMIVLGWTPPGGSRIGLGSLHVGYYDPFGRLHYAGGVGTGFSDDDLAVLSETLASLAAEAPPGLLVGGEPIGIAINWVRPVLVAEIQFTGWSGGGRLRHAVFLGLREDKMAQDVVRDIADAKVERTELATKRPGSSIVTPRRSRHVAVPPLPAERATADPTDSNRVVVARAPKRAAIRVGGIEITHADRPLWPGITKQDLAEYWQSVADWALPGIARRPLAILRCPEGVEGGESFFQKHGHGHMPPAIREGTALKQPFLAIDDVAGLISMAQMSAIELHPWSATEADPAHPDRLVFDLDPGEGVAWAELIQAAHEVKDRLERLGLRSFCRTTGGKGLHVVMPLTLSADWDRARQFCRAFAEAMEAAQPDRYVAHVKIADRRGKILVDWLRNGIGATAVASFSPRARSGATVATPLSWSEVTPRLSPAAFTVQTVPGRLAGLQADPWEGFGQVEQMLPDLSPDSESPPPLVKAKAAGQSRIVVASRPKRRG